MSTLLTCPLPLLHAHTLGLPLQAAWTALECVAQEAAPHQAVLRAIEGVLDEPCSQREVLRRLAGGHAVVEVKRALDLAASLGLVHVSAGPRRSYIYRRVAS